MIRSGVPAPSLAGRMGALPFRERGGVAYRELRTRCLLNRCDAPQLPFEWTVNPYRGCAMGCRYCYAAYTHEFMGITAPEEFHTTVFVKTGGDEQTALRVAAVVRSGARIALGTATDPYQPGEAHLNVTRRFLECVAQQRGVRLGITTKGAVILRDLALLRRINERSLLSVNVSLISPDAELLRRVEPLAPPPAVRLEVMRRLVESGIRVSMAVMPVLPALTDSEPDLDELLGRARAAGVERLGWRTLFLRSPTREKYLRWLAAEFPRYLEAYRRAYSGRVYLGGRYRRLLDERLSRLHEKHGFSRRDDDPAWQPAPRAEQLGLWP